MADASRHRRQGWICRLIDIGGGVEGRGRAGGDLCGGGGFRVQREKIFSIENTQCEEKGEKKNEHINDDGAGRLCTQRLSAGAGTLEHTYACDGATRKTLRYSFTLAFYDMELKWPYDTT